MGKVDRVAVVGLGASGLTALKNLREAGFDAVGFDANNYVGGLWVFNKDPESTSVLKSTIGNVSATLQCYTDFPYPEDAPAFPPAAQTAQYLQSYANRFGLMEHARLSTKVEHIGRRDDRWIVKSSQVGSKAVELEAFDRLVVTTGLQVQKARVPQVSGMETFTGQAIHSMAYKDPSDFDGKNVVVLGLGITGPDVALDLIGHAKNVWFSSRRGNAILKRTDRKGKPWDFILSVQGIKLGAMFNKYLPTMSQWATTLGLRYKTNEAFDIPREWGLREIHSTVRKLPTMSDQLVPALHAGKLEFKRGLSKVSGSTLLFADGSEIHDVDSIIFCTGFRSDFHLLDSTADPTRDTRKDWMALPGADSRPLPRLYQGIFSLDFPDSLAFIGTSPLTPQSFLNFDISSAAVAQTWAGKSSLPSMTEMTRHVDAQHEVVCGIAATGEVANTNMRNNWEWYKWCDAAAGLGVVKRTSWSIEGWKFWFKNRELSKLVGWGILSPHIFRLFDEGKRRPWDQAYEELRRINALAKRDRP